ncbi:hypothetical protein DRO54_08815, partial [Candidatus Bathyarchaeota archaeon]
EKIIEALKSNGGELSTLEVAEKAGIPRNKAAYYLQALAAEGVVERRFKGKAILVWRLKENV